MNWLFWRKKPRITVKVGDTLTIRQFGRKREIEIIGLTDALVYYRRKHDDIEDIDIVTHAELKQSIVELEILRTQIEI